MTALFLVRFFAARAYGTSPAELSSPNYSYPNFFDRYIQCRNMLENTFTQLSYVGFKILKISHKLMKLAFIAVKFSVYLFNPRDKKF